MGLTITTKAAIVKAVKPVRIMGLDISTYTGLACLEGSDEIGTKLINFPKAKGFVRLQLIANAVRNVVQEWGPSICVIEHYAYGNKFTLVTLVEVGTAIRMVLKELGVPWVEVPPTVLKKFITGKGNAKKDQMAISVLERYGFTSKSDDVVDAYALAAFGRELASNGFTQLPEGVHHAS